MTTSPLIDIQQISYAYPTQKVGNSETHSVFALRNVSLQVQEGEYLAILGHNGSGKSTLARHCNALLIPNEGRVFITGYDTTDPINRRTIRDTVGMIFQSPDNQFIATVVEDDIAWGLSVRGYAPSLIRERVDSSMEAVGITHLRKLPPHQLSGGQRQRVAIAGIMALRPRCIIADEATAQLDPLSRREVVTLLHQLRRAYGLTIIHVTHLLEEVVQADRILIMERGQIVLDDTPPRLFTHLEQLHNLKLTLPEPIVLANRLRASGLPISRDALTIEAIAREIMP